MNITVSIKTNSAEGKAICTAAKAVGLEAEEVLMGVCLNAARRACTAQDPDAAIDTASGCCLPAAPSPQTKLFPITNTVQ